MVVLLLGEGMWVGVGRNLSDWGWEEGVLICRFQLPYRLKFVPWLQGVELFGQCSVHWLLLLPLIQVQHSGLVQAFGALPDLTYADVHSRR